jgi:hypothetical protein
MSNATVLDKPKAANDLPTFWRVVAEPRRLWRVWNLLDQSGVGYTEHGAFGWDWFPQRMVLVELHGTAQEIAKAVNDFERYRFSATAIESIETAFPAELAGAFPVDSEKPVAGSAPDSAFS